MRVLAGQIEACVDRLSSSLPHRSRRICALHTIDWMAILQATGALAENTRPFRGSFVMCGTPMETKAGVSAGVTTGAYLGPAGGDTAPVAINPLSIATAPHCLDSAFASNRPSAT